jgi:hypothetical protein
MEDEIEALKHALEEKEAKEKEAEKNKSMLSNLFEKGVIDSEGNLKE